MNKIFINIAAYRDPELIPTVRDAIKMAKNKDRLSFGVCWQFSDDEPKNFNEDDDALFEGVKLRYIRIPAAESYGMNWARKLAHGFWTEDYNFYLQIDSHMRFVQDWDYELLKTIAKCDSDKPVLTQRCFPYYPEKGSKKKDIDGSTFMHAKKFRDNGVVVVSAAHVNTKREKLNKPFPQAFISGHFMFSRSSLIKEMPYDEDIAVIATGDEPLLGMKAWTRGWDIFSPHKPILYHHFYREQSPKMHEDHKKEHEIPWRGLADKGVQRSNQINFENYIGKYGLGTKRTLKQFGEYAGVDFESREVITEDRIDKPFRDVKERPSGLKKLMLDSVNGPTLDPAAAKGKIFVQIASYRDPDVKETIRNMVENAAKPENLIVGVCDQYGPENEYLKEYDQENFRVIRLPFYISKGLGWARALIQELYFDDAEYTMQLDSHMRFVKNWDKKLIKMLKATGSEKPIISHYCPGFSTKDIKDDKYLRKTKGLMKMYCLRFNDTGTVSFRQTPTENTSAVPEPSMLVSGHFYFTLGKHIKEYKYDPNLYFAGDEISLATRSWTRGWDIFNPSENVVFHNYTREERVCHWSDQKVGYSGLHKESLKKLRQMLHGEDNGLDLGEYGLGDERELKEFEKISGIDFKERTLHQHAKDGEVRF